VNRIFEILDFESDTKNWNSDFKIISKKYGRDFIDIISAMWAANDGVQTEEEFCEMNGLPKPFFENVIKNKSKNIKIL